MVLPEFDYAGNLPAGIHRSTLAEITARFGYTPARRVLLDGSFVTASDRTSGREPADYDLCRDIAGINLDVLAAREPALDPLRPDRAAVRRRYGGDLFLVVESLGVGLLEAFQHDRDGRQKGIVLLDPQEERGQR